MQDKYEWEKVLILVMTYPHPSKSYLELICTAGITEDGKWVRLYPIDYRYRPKNQQFHKYQWIEDWELGVLYLKETDRFGSESKAAESVKNKYLNELCSENNDTKFLWEQHGHTIHG